MRKVWRLLPVFWLVFGVIFACVSYSGYDLLQRAGRNAEQMTHQIEPKETSQKRIEQKSKEATYDTDQIKPVTPEEFAAAQLKYEKIVNQWGIGAIYIPGADIRTKILAGMDNQNLMVGVGTYYPNQQLGKGNYVVLAHNLVQGGGPLGNIPQTALHQIFYATDFSTVFEYTAVKNDIVSASAGELLDIPKEDERPLMTLIRCEGGINTVNRAVLQGTFVKSYPAEKASMEVKLGLGLIEQKSIVVDAEIPQSTSGEETSIEVKQGNTKKESPQIYSFFQELCIHCFLLLNTHPIESGIGYLLGMFLLSHLAIWKQKSEY